MRKISTFKLLFKCCHKLQDSQKGYMLNGVYIENISYYAWNNLTLWRQTLDEKHKNNLIELFADIKRKQAKNWQVFIKQPPTEINPFKANYQLILSEIEPPEPYILYDLGIIKVYETYMFIGKKVNKMA